MALVDWRRVLDADPHRADSATVALEVTDAGADVSQAFRHKLRVQVSDDGCSAYADLDYYALGELVDQLREAMGVLLALQGDPVATAALAGLARAHDTPADGASE